MKIELAKTEVVHFVGIGGIGMSGLSLIMKGKGFKVQGSDLNFNKNVELKYLDHVIFTKNMDLSFQKNFAWLYTDVIYKSSDYELFADKIEIDLITKNSKIYTNNDKKVKIIKK